MSVLREQKMNLTIDSDMTPMVDVTFLLLIFFMVTVAFTMQRSMVVPRSVDKGPIISAAMNEVEADIVVEVDAFNTFHVTADNFDEQAVLLAPDPKS